MLRSLYGFKSSGFKLSWVAHSSPNCHQILERIFVYTCKFLHLILYLPHLSLKTSCQYKELCYTHVQMITANIVLLNLNRFLKFFSACRISEISVKLVKFNMLMWTSLYSSSNALLLLQYSQSSRDGSREDMNCEVHSQI